MNQMIKVRRKIVWVVMMLTMMKRKGFIVTTADQRQ